MTELFKAPAKINLSLDVVSKREDGYHNIESVFQTVSLYDIIEVEVSPGNNISIFQIMPICRKIREILCGNVQKKFLIMQVLKPI